MFCNVKTYQLIHFMSYCCFEHNTKLVSSISHLPYSERLRALGLPPLEYRRERADVIQVYKILHDIDKVDKNKLFTLSLSMPVKLGHLPRQTCSACNAMIGP